MREAFKEQHQKNIFYTTKNSPNKPYVQILTKMEKEGEWTYHTVSGDCAMRVAPVVLQFLKFSC